MILQILNDSLFHSGNQSNSIIPNHWIIIAWILPIIIAWILNDSANPQNMPFGYCFAAGLGCSGTPVAARVATYVRCNLRAATYADDY